MIITALRQRNMSSYVMIWWALIASKFISWQVKRVSPITEEYDGNTGFGISVSDGIYCHDLYEIGGRGSPSLVGRGIANPMSERTRGFEILWIRYEIPTPRAFFFVFLFSGMGFVYGIRNAAPHYPSRRLDSVATGSNPVTISSNVKPFALIMREILFHKGCHLFIYHTSELELVRLGYLLFSEQPICHWPWK